MKTILLSILVCLTVSAVGQNSSCKCCTEEHMKFDFWKGEWNVTSNGKKAGTNNIYYVQDNCILVENWTGNAGYTGQSMNYYDPQDKTWNQLWIDNQGGSLNLKGQFDGKSMILMSAPKINEKNQLVINKITWTPLENGDVRQLWELTQDGGNNWNIVFNGIYAKK